MAESPFPKVLEALDELEKEILLATGKNKAGKMIGRPRFDGFDLLPDMREEIREAIQSLQKRSDEQVAAVVQEIIEHLRGRQVAYLRAILFPDGISVGYFSRRLIDLNEKRVGGDLSDPISRKVAEFETRALSNVDLEQTSRMFWEIAGRIEKAGEEYRRRQANEASAARRERQITEVLAGLGQYAA